MEQRFSGVCLRARANRHRRRHTECAYYVAGILRMPSAPLNALLLRRATAHGMCLLRLASILEFAADEEAVERKVARLRRH
jgi:hypothetical protein